MLSNIGLPGEGAASLTWQRDIPGISRERRVWFNKELLQVDQFKPPKIQQQAIQARLNYFLGAEEYDRLFVAFEILRIENEVLTLGVLSACTSEVQDKYSRRYRCRGPVETGDSESERHPARRLPPFPGAISFGIRFFYGLHPCCGSWKRSDRRARRPLVGRGWKPKRSGILTTERESLSARMSMHNASFCAFTITRRFK
jgi:hypothetical protein